MSAATGADAGRRGRVRPLLVALLALVALAGSVLLPVRAAAHAAPVRSDPAADSAVRVPPARVTIWFSEPLAPALSKVEVLDAAGKRIDDGDSLTDPADATKLSVGVPPLPNGTYTVAWSNVSTVDGHPLRGSFVFFVGERPPGAASTGAQAPPILPSPADPWIRWAVLLAALAATGSLVLDAAVLRPALASAGGRGAGQRTTERARTRLAKMARASTAALVIASIAQFAVQASVATGVALWEVRAEHVVAVLGQTDWGKGWAARVALALVALGCLAASRRVRPGTSVRALLGTAAPLAALLLALGTFSLSSHAAAVSALRFPALVTDYVHLLAAATWTGALFALLPTLVVLVRALPAGERRPVLAEVTRRFSVVAALGLGTLVLTGLYSSWLHVTELAALRTPYGVTLLSKTALVVVLALTGAANLLWVRPRLARAEQADDASHWLRRLAAAEVVVAVLVLLAVGFLTSLEPARQTYQRSGGGGIRFTQSDAGTRVEAQIVPGIPGNNRVLISLRDRRDAPVTNAGSVTVRLRYVDVDLGATEVNALPTADGRYEVPAVAISIAGRWEMQVLVTRPDAGDATVASRFTVGASAAGTSGPPADTGRTLWSWLVVGVGMLALVITPHAFRGRIARTRIRIIATTVLMVGVVLVYGAHSHSGPTEQAGVNPVPATAQSIEAGRQLFQQECAVCHGPTGLGDGPQAKALTPPPADLTAHVPLHGDGQVFQFISGGFPGSAMPAFAGRLSDTQIWNLVNFLRALSAPPPRQ